MLINVETRHLLQIILNARSDAIMDGCERRLYIEPAKNRFVLQKFDSPNRPPAEEIKLSDNITINNTTYIGNKFLDFKPIGTVSMGGHITLKSPKLKYKTIVIQIGTGRIYMKEGKIDD